MHFIKSNPNPNPNLVNMASLDDIINITDEQAEIIIKTDDATKACNLLFTFDKTQPIDNQVSYDDIYYLDNSKTFIPTKPSCKYILKNHQLTTLYYMLELENMLFNVRCIT